MNTDEQIVEAVKDGGSKGLELMVSHFGQQVFAMIARQVGNAMDAEELTQDTFLRAFSHIASYDPRRASLATWLSRIAYRLTLDFLKRQRPLIVSIDDTEVWQTDISNEQLEAELSTGNEERILRLQLLMDNLPTNGCCSRCTTSRIASWMNARTLWTPPLTPWPTASTESA